MINITCLAVIFAQIKNKRTNKIMVEILCLLVSLWFHVALKFFLLLIFEDLSSNTFYYCDKQKCWEHLEMCNEVIKKHIRIDPLFRFVSMRNNDTR